MMSLIRRNRPGTRASDLYNWAPEDYSKKKGLFAVQEYIQELIRDNPANIKKIIEPPKGVDLNAWKYEHLRQFILETNLLIVQLKGICTKDTCPKMKATEDWLYLCAVHKEPQDCPAIDYMIHNLDQMSSNLNSSKYFSSRVSIDKSNMKYLEEIIRRLYRYFSHCYFNHPNIFSDFEKEMHLCERFTEYIKVFGMMSTKYLIIPQNIFSNFG
ncbi:MAG: Mob1/phocein family protein [archaeon]|nr:Mob1/phocein family protein [archaeon]